MEKPFFRESNKWRLIGLGVALLSGLVNGALPKANFVIGEFGKSDYWFIPEKLTLLGATAMCGIGLFIAPTVKEMWRAFRGQKP